MGGIVLTRRAALSGLLSALAAPVIVQAGSIMPVKAIEPASGGFFVEAINTGLTLTYRLVADTATSREQLERFIAHIECRREPIQWAAP